MLRLIKKLLDRYKQVPEAAKASIWFVICNVIQRGISVITVPIFTRLLTPDQYGVFNVYNSWYGIISIIITLNLSWSAYTVGLSKNEEDADRFTSSLQNVPVLLSCVGALFILLGGKFWENLLGLSGAMILLMFVETAMTPALQFWSNRQRYFYRYKALIGVTIAIAVLSPLIGILLVQMTELKAEARIISTVAVNAGFGLFFYMLNQRRGKVFYTPKYWKFAFIFSLPLIPHYLSQTVLNQADRIMINNMVGSAETAIYSVAYSVASIFTIINTSINHSLTPWLYRELKKTDKSQIGRYVPVLSILVLLLNLMYICLAPEVIAIFAPESYGEAVSVIPPLAMSTFLMFVYSVFISIELFFEENKHVLWSSLASALLNVILNYIFIGKYGYLAAGYTSLFCYMVYAIGHYYIMDRTVQKHLGCKHIIDGERLALITLVGIAATVILALVYDKPFVRYMIVVSMAAIMVIRRKSIMKWLRTVIAKSEVERK